MYLLTTILQQQFEHFFVTLAPIMRAAPEMGERSFFRSYLECMKELSSKKMKHKPRRKPWNAVGLHWTSNTAREWISSNSWTVRPCSPRRSSNSSKNLERNVWEGDLSPGKPWVCKRKEQCQTHPPQPSSQRSSNRSQCRDGVRHYCTEIRWRIPDTIRRRLETWHSCANLSWTFCCWRWQYHAYRLPLLFWEGSICSVHCRNLADVWHFRRVDRLLLMRQCIGRLGLQYTLWWNTSKKHLWMDSFCKSC